MNEQERKAVEAEPRIFEVVAVDDEHQFWTVWERKPRGFRDDQTLRGFTVEERVRYHLDATDYHEMSMEDFMRHGLPETKMPYQVANLMCRAERIRDELFPMKLFQERPMGQAELNLIQACLSMTLCMLRRARNGDASDRAYLYGVASLGAAVYEMTRRMLNADMFESVHDHVREILTMANGMDEYASSAHDALLEAECE